MEQNQIRAYAAVHADEALRLTEELCRIPAPFLLFCLNRKAPFFAAWEGEVKRFGRCG